MNAISAEEWELVSFFEENPEYVDPNDPWPYTDALFRVEQGARVLTFAVMPAYRDVRIVLRESDQVLYELNAMAVVDVRYRREGSVELLDVVLGEYETLTLSLKPTLRLDHKVTRPDRH
jgi:hypothetical protein